MRIAPADLRESIISDQLTDNEHHEGQPVTDQAHMVTISSPSADPGMAWSSQDLWSAAYREAVESFRDLDPTILEGNNVMQLFHLLEDAEQEATGDTIFQTGRKWLEKLETPLKALQIALDLASPVSSLEPTAATAIGVVKTVTTVSATDFRVFI